MGSLRFVISPLIDLTNMAASLTCSIAVFVQFFLAIYHSMVKGNMNLLILSFSVHLANVFFFFLQQNLQNNGCCIIIYKLLCIMNTIIDYSNATW